MKRNKFIVSLVSNLNQNNGGSSSSRIDSTSTCSTILENNKIITNNNALVINTINETEGENDCVELRKEMVEAMKVLMDDCGEQNDELLLLRDQVNGK